jgi:hypothetical protein
MSTLLTRIKEIAEKEGVTVGFIEKQIGASKGVLSRAIKNNTDIQAKWLQTIVENYPGYSAAWLLTGEVDNGIVADPSHAYSAPCPQCEQKDQRITDLQETIASLKETNAVLKELLSELKKK